MINMRNISVVIPAYNEEKNIGRTLVKIVDYFNKKRARPYEIIVVDDGGSDKTAEKVNYLIRKNKRIKLLKNGKNRGKGYSVKRGVLCAKYPLILFSDADLSTPIEELDKFVDLIQKYDMVIASRNLKESDIQSKQPFYRAILGKFFALIVNILIFSDFKDTQCGFKLFKKDVVKEVFPLQTFNGFSFDVEVLCIAKKKKYSIKEAPVVWMSSNKSEVSPLKDPIRMFRDVLKIKLNSMRGYYSKR